MPKNGDESRRKRLLSSTKRSLKVERQIIVPRGRVGRNGRRQNKARLHRAQYGKSPPGGGADTFGGLQRPGTV